MSSPLPNAVNLVDQAHANTWTTLRTPKHIPDTTTLYHTPSRTKASDPLASMACNFAIAHLKQLLQSAFANDVLASAIQHARGHPAPTGPRANSPPDFSYVDDITIVLILDNPAEAPNYIAQDTQILLIEFHILGFTLNFNRNKTEIAINHAAPCSKEMRNAFYATRRHDPCPRRIEPPHPTPHSARLHPTTGNPITIATNVAHESRH